MKKIYFSLLIGGLVALLVSTAAYGASITGSKGSLSMNAGNDLGWDVFAPCSNGQTITASSSATYGWTCSDFLSSSTAYVSSVNGATSTVSLTIASSGQSGIQVASSTSNLNRTWALSQPTSTASVNGYLSSGDWTTFNAKQNAITFPIPVASTSLAVSPSPSLVVSGNTLTLAQQINSTSSPTFASGTLSNFTAGSVPFIGVGGALRQNNTNLFFDNANIRLGVGTSTPISTFHVVGTSTFGGGQNGVVDLATTYFPQNGNWVMGNNSPTMPALGTFLHVFGSSTQDRFMAMGFDPASSCTLNFGYSGFSFGPGSSFFNARPCATATGSNPSIRFLTGNTFSMIVDGNQRIGIGTTTPQSAFQVWSPASTTARIGDTTSRGCLTMGDSDGSGVTYVTVNNGTLSATTTKPAFCQ